MVFQWYDIDHYTSFFTHTSSIYLFQTWKEIRISLFMWKSFCFHICFNIYLGRRSTNWILIIYCSVTDTWIFTSR
eukprot:UN26092